MRTPDIEVAKKELAVIAGKIAKLEADHGEAFKRKARTKELIQIGALFKHYFPKGGVENAEKIFHFWSVNKGKYLDDLKAWKAKLAENGDIPLSVEVDK